MREDAEAKRTFEEVIEVGIYEETFPEGGEDALAEWVGLHYKVNFYSITINEKLDRSIRYQDSHIA